MGTTSRTSKATTTVAPSEARQSATTNLFEGGPAFWAALSFVQSPHGKTVGKNILVVTRPPDLHAVVIAEALRRKGANVTLWQTADYPGRASESVHVQGGFPGSASCILVTGSDLPTETVHSVWHRRPAWKVDEESLHPADVEFADLQCRVFRTGLWDVAYPTAFWVNRPGAARRANTKIVQQRAALEVGLLTPDTLYSNDPGEIRLFIHSCGGQAVYKPLWPLPWKRENVAWYPLTTVVDENSLTGDGPLRNSPGIYQALIPKRFEVRLTVMGRSLFGAKIDSQNTKHGRLDWRRAYDELQITPLCIPEDIGGRCIGLLRLLGLTFGCFDFIVSPTGDWVFLEVNQMGQFLFLERMAGLPMVDAFSEFLIEGDGDFEWQSQHPYLRYGDLEPLAEKLVRQTQEDHVTSCGRYLQEPA